MRTSSKRALVLAGVLAAFAATADAFAQEHEPSANDWVQAREMYNDGKQLRARGDIPGALEKLRAANAIAATPLTGFEMGKTLLMLGRLVEAEEAFLAVARLRVRAEETERSAEARRESARLAEEVRRRIPSLTIRVTGVPADSVAVSIDGAAIPTQALEAPRFVDPGPHEVSARSTTGGTADTRVDLKEGETRTVELTIVFKGTPSGWPQAAAPLPPSPEPAPARSHALEWSLVGGGAAVGVAGVALMLVGASQGSDAAHSLDRSAYDSARTMYTAGLVVTLAGGGALAAGGILVLSASSTGSRTRASAWVGAGPGELHIGGTW